jgi:catechol 2,3-dioxygenase-like lactoylglutathione lyase family enzyme
MFQKTKAFFSVSVDDLAAASRFYGETLGLHVKETPEGLEIQIEGGGILFLYRKPNHVPATFTVLNFLVERVDSSVEELKRRGVKFEVYDEPDLQTDANGISRGNGGPTIAWFKDPAGNILSVLEPKR